VEKQDLARIIATAVRRGAPSSSAAVAQAVANAVIGDLDAANLRIHGPDGKPIRLGNGSGERRAAPRHRVLKSGTIIHSGGKCTMECIILDMSTDGALLKPMDILFCPQEFTLKPQIGEARACEVKWRDGTVAGVRFL